MPRLATGSVLQLADGTWWGRITFKDETGKRRERRKRAINKTDAKDKRDDLLLELKKHGVVAAGNDRVTFEELADYFDKQYLIPAEYKDNVKIAGVRDTRNYKSMLKTLREHFGTKRLRHLTYGDLREFKLSRLRTKSQRVGDETL